MKCHRPRRLCNRRKSHPARGAWIEISVCAVTIAHALVAPRKGCVD